MKKLLTTSTLILAVTFTASSQAGSLDGLLGGNKDKTTASEQTVTSTGQVVSSVASALSAEGGDSLVSLVTSQLGVSNEQATGGLGAIFQTAKNTLSSGEFSTLAEAVPGMDVLLSAAPSAESSGLGGLLAKAGSAGELLSAFDKLGLTSEQLVSFTNLIKAYFEGSGQAGLSDLLMKGIGSFM